MTAAEADDESSQPATNDHAGATALTTHSLGTARMADGTTLRTLHWERAAEPWALAEIVHGLGEHGGRYETVAEALTAAGIDTWAYDHRGNGGAGGRRGHTDPGGRPPHALSAPVPGGPAPPPPR